jgi:hypothetical protein
MVRGEAFNWRPWKVRRGEALKNEESECGRLTLLGCGGKKWVVVGQNGAKKLLFSNLGKFSINFV